MVRGDVMMARACRPSPKPSITLRAFFVQRTRQAFAYQTPLNGEIGAFVDGESFINSPAHRAMINNQMAPTPAKAILFFSFFVPRAKAHVPNDHIVRIEIHLIILYANSVSRRRLTRNRQ